MPPLRDGFGASAEDGNVKQKPLIQLRDYQREVFRAKYRRLFLLWERRAGKSFTLASEALDLMMATPGDLVTFISASIVLGSEFLLKEVRLWQQFLDLYRKAATQAGLKLESNVDGLNLDDVADIFEHSKLETKLWHDNTTCSRSRVIAPNPDTAVGWGAHIMGDEIGRWPNAKEVLEAVIPFMRENPRLKMRLATTPPPDDSHITFEMFLPPQEEFPINPLGNWFKAPCGIMTHRLDCYDRYAAGFSPFHPDTGVPITPDEDRKLAYDKTAWDRNQGLRFVVGGAAAVPLMQLQNAMVRGRGNCFAYDITEELVA